VNGQVFNQVPDGNDVQLTVDRELQFIVEQELAEAVRNHEADAAVGVVLDAQTSEVLAMASSPSFDPNRAGEFPASLKRNRAITDSFEPGSTLKTFVIAGALAQGQLEPNTKYDCEGGALKIGRRTVREADGHHRFEQLTVSEILAVSSNVGMTKIAFQLGSEKVLETLRRFGFGEKTGIDLPGEAKGIIQSLPWHDHLLSNISFGHGFTATPLQIANAYAAIANGGWLKQPYVVKSVRDHEGTEILATKPRVLRRVLTDDQVAKMKIMLAGVTSEIGTGQNARVPGFPVAGKTGTAQKVNPNGRGYIPGGYISSFAGFLPANDPRFVIYVAVDRPRKEYYGAAVAAPVFSRIAQFAVRRAGLAPVLIKSENLVPQARRVVNPVRPQPATRDLASDPTLAQAGAVVPDLTGLTLREVLARVTGSGLKVNVQGEGFVTSTTPPPGAKLAESQELTVTLSR
jgi:cell division protein FtsI (penicillin-binding protein 3)